MWTFLVNVAWSRCIAAPIVVLVFAIVACFSAQAQSLSSSSVLPPGEEITQSVTLDEGWNLVSFFVAPDDPTLEELLAPYEDEIVLVKELSGHSFMASTDLDQIGTWGTQQSYFIYADTDVVLDVSGIVVDPEDHPIALEEGWSLIPFLLSEPVDVEEAFASIMGSLLIADDARGNVFIPELGIASLDSLRPGQGYQVYVEEDETLVYESPVVSPPPDDPEPDEPVQVNTLAEALALEGMEVGQEIEILGYHEPSDGGGGTFEVTNSGAETDGGTVFVFDEDQSAQQQETFTSDFKVGQNPEAMPHQDLVWGTVEMHHGDGTLGVITWRELHGHARDRTNYRWVDYEAGLIGSGDDNEDRFKQMAERLYDTQSIEWTVKYKYATSNRRLERQGITDSVNIKWWGAPEADPSDIQNARPHIAWATNRAALLREEQNMQSGDWAYVDIPGHFYYRYTLNLRPWVKLRGASDQDFGELSNGEYAKGKLQLPPQENENEPGMVADFLVSQGYTTMWQERRQLLGLAMARMDLTNERFPEAEENSDTAIGMESLEIDGNIAENPYPIDNDEDYAYIPWWDEGGDINNHQFGRHWIQERNVWNGLAIDTRSQTVKVDRPRAILTGVYLHNFVGNGIVSGNRYDFTESSNVRVGRAPRNHQMYNVWGDHTGWTVEGAGWYSLIRITGGDLKDFTYRNAEPMGDFWTGTQAPGGSTWSLVLEHERKFDAQPFENQTLTIDGFTIDLSDGNDRDVRVLSNDSPATGNVMENGTVIGQPEEFTTVYSSRFPQTVSKDQTISNVVVEGTGGCVRLVFLTRPAFNTRFQDILVKNSEGSTGTCFPIGRVDFYSSSDLDATFNATSSDYKRTGRMTVDNLTMVDSHEAVAPFVNFGNHDSDSIPYDVFVSNSILLNNTNGGERTLLVGSQGRPASEELPKRFAQRLYLVDTSILMAEDGGAHNHLTNAPRYLPDADWAPRSILVRGVTDDLGRTSEDSGTLTSDANDEGNDYVLIPTNLFTYAFETEAEIISGPSGLQVEGVDVADDDGTLRDPTDPTGQTEPYLRVNLSQTIGSGETVTIDWDARVTPLGELSRTGVFIPRPFYERPFFDTTFNVGDSTKTIDLRGVAASLESEEPIDYTAVSDDTSVVQASVQADGYTLELDFQGTGTATITVTGEIPGVGSAEDTFGVTVE